MLLIALGSNCHLGDMSAENIVKTALEYIVCDITSLGATQANPSRLWRSNAFPAGSGPTFVNAALRLEGEVNPDDVLEMLHRIEAAFHRERVQRWGPRTLDLDLIACGETVLPDLPTQRRWMDLSAEAQMSTTPETLILPHPRLQDRAFVLAPLAEIAPEWRHPVLGLRVDEMLDALPSEAWDGLTPLDEDGGALG